MRLNGILKDDMVINIKGERHEIFDICYNSKDCTKDSMFVAIKGGSANGASYINEAISSGANTIVLNGGNRFDAPKNITKIQVSDARRFLALASSAFYDDPTKKLSLFGITGTNGKTTISYLLESIFKKANLLPAVVGTIKNRFNGMNLYKSPVTTPESRDFQKIASDVFNLGAKSLICEVSSHALMQERVSYSHFDACIFTNLTQDHLDYHKSMEEYFNAKLKLFTKILRESGKQKKFAVLNLDDPCGEKIAARLDYPYYFYSTSSDSSYLKVKDSYLGIDGIKARLESQRGLLDISSQIIGKFNLENILAAVTLALLFGIDSKHIQEGISDMKLVPGRLERISNNLGINIFVDYAHTEKGLLATLETLSLFKEGRLINVFGCGGNRDKTKRPKMGEVSSKYADLTILTDDNPRHEDPPAIIYEIEKGVNASKVNKEDLNENWVKGKKIYTIVQNRRDAIRLAIKIAEKGDIVAICGKGHEDYQQIGEKRIHFSDKEEIEEILGRK